MGKKTVYLLGILLTILIGTYFYWKHCCGGKLAAQTEKSVVSDTENNNANRGIEATLRNSFKLSDPNGNFSFRTDNNFNFNSSDFKILLPVSEDLNTGIDDLQLYLDEHEVKQIDITGLYALAEDNTSAFPNLGMARATSVKNYFVSRGIDASRLNLFGKSSDAISASDNIYYGPLNISFSEAGISSEEKEKESMNALKKSIQDDPLILNFANAQTQINLSEAQRQKIADIARYLDKVEDGKALVTGHTDNTGSREGNILIGQKRADFAKSYLISNGISAANIESIGKGSDEPIATNDSEEGRSKNRRTVVTVN
ncbi:OmpA family protein [Ulvibacter antarcticus]|uniref:Outer membrane protein OmpA-like peptidoglycan-associated protein n=1 Tax=Ulvibacter antarcticus TaxID=442714 RepID=A0A3L9YZI7_9FLAO|nr:OmpA family protein [Ulvibacter antarcticus]RMA66121.1 outer membrane protein OmpA-like peptidoglycan-associated protein [Ulvibacter antarcticus]